ncbi:L,D-transpeptidase [Actinomycetospora straminea]|uniref:L,D-transpeptidase LdtMt5 n=1 Tax=Actinomycetospora straminea TaxID=663607 RepID=A0ABP9ELE2_9PSEU|nr:Ig-like domain-containing protein [Actinomycetospora straminea]MDD7936463.1 Ig-like domain-containing protein [Actinomycetospora straminea]
MRGRLQGVLAVLVALVAVAGVVVGCAAAGATPPVPGAPSADAPPSVTTTAAAGRTDVDPGGEISVSAPDAALRDVALTGADGRGVAGTTSPDGHRWTADEALGYGRSYTWSGSAVGADGAVTPIAGGFTTVTPDRVVRAQFAQPDDATVGVAAPIVIQFDGPVTDKAAAERALSIRTSVPTEGSWAWLPDDADGSRVHWRPKEYWQPGTVVDVRADLYGVALGDGAYGREDLTSHLTVGRSQIVRADVGSHRMVVIRDGQQVMDVPASYGLGSDPNRITRSGTHVVTEKFDNKRMTSAQYGYDLIEHWAVRISNNGEFIHANPASASAQGSSNVTHGCVNLSTADARAYYDTALYGDPVEVTGSPVQLSAADGDVYDWAIGWDQWRGMSALS